MTRAVVFGYHNVGVRCLQVLQAHGVEIELVVTHADDEGENIWFDNLAACAAQANIDTITPEADELDTLVARLKALAPDFIFSFYYRHLLPTSILETATQGAYNMHGSLLPDYRGRAPVNWAVLQGARYTGASLHAMVEKPDAGALLAQTPVPILDNDTAATVMEKVTWAAEKTLDETLPSLIAGQATSEPLDLSKGRYFGRRRPQDGEIDWQQPAQTIHNLVRAVAPPYPGAFTLLGRQQLWLYGSWFNHEPARYETRLPVLYAQAGRIYIDCIDGRRFEVLSAYLDKILLHAEELVGNPIFIGDEF